MFVRTILVEGKTTLGVGFDFFRNNYKVFLNISNIIYFVRSGLNLDFL